MMLIMSSDFGYQMKLVHDLSLLFTIIILFAILEISDK